MRPLHDKNAVIQCQVSQYLEKYEDLLQRGRNFYEYRKYAAQVPSLETMHGPTGAVGVQTFE